MAMGNPADHFSCTTSFCQQYGKNTNRYGENRGNIPNSNMFNCQTDHQSVPNAVGKSGQNCRKGFNTAHSASLRQYAVCYTKTSIPAFRSFMMDADKPESLSFIESPVFTNHPAGIFAVPFP